MSAPPHGELYEACRRRVGMTIEDRYELAALIGYGATGAVYRAEHRLIGRTYALKLFHYHGQNWESALKRFVREARATNRVRRNGRPHPNVVAVFDVGRDAATGFFFLVEELLQGETLAAHLARQPGGRVPFARALDLLAPVLDAIAAAHDVGVVHRDLRPDHVFLAEPEDGGEPVPKVLDFGLAQLTDARMTPTQEVLGTPEYMPPEAFLSASGVDARADVWALGVMLYEMVTGVSPFRAPSGNPIDAMRRVATTAPPSLEGSGLLPPAGWDALCRALARDPAARLAHARELLVALAAARGGA